MDKKLILIDAMALIYRAYFAFNRNPLINSRGMNVSAISGFTSTLFDLVTNEKPTHIAVAFDSYEPTEREVEYDQYKANRQETPEDIVLSIPYIKSIIEAFNIPIFEVPGYEADDIIGTIAKKIEKNGFEVYMVTPDKDFGQLVSENIFILKPPFMGKGFEKMGVPEILKKWEIDEIHQVTDILGLWGDAVDNIPGIPGIGEKTAKKLIKEFGSIENVIENHDKFKGKLQQNIIEFAEQALLSKRLATIICDTPIEIKEQDLQLTNFDKDKLEKIFSDLEFRNLGKRIIGDSFQMGISQQRQMALFSNENNNDKFIPPEKSEPNGLEKTIDNTTHKYYLIDTTKKQLELVNTLVKQKEVCFDTETTSIDANNAELVGISFAFKKHQAYYVPIPENKSEAKKVLKIFQPFFENDQITKIGQNIKYDILVLKWSGITVNGSLYDTMLAHYLIEPDMRHNLNRLAAVYLAYSPIPIENIIGKKGKNQGNMRDAPIENVVNYAGEDADITLQLKEKLIPVLQSRNGEELLNKVELPLINVLVNMEYEGVGIDKSVLQDYSNIIGKELNKTEKRVYELAGVEFNLASPKQLGEVLFKKMKIEYSGKKTKTGQFATNEEVLNKLAPEHEIANQLLQHRELSKLKSTYVDALPKLVNPRTGRIHTSFNQAIAATGRLSSANPNLQNIPIRTERGREIRKAFIPRNNNYTLLSADYSQVELRIVAEVSRDKSLLAAFQQGQDIHSATASKVYGVPMDKVTAEMRRNAKTVNFGIIYGISSFGLSQRLNISRGEAKELIDQYFIKYPDVKQSMEASIIMAQKKGYVETMMGRRRYLRDINSRNHTVRGFAERNAINAPIQGTAADMIKLAMINIHDAIIKNKFKSKMILQVHDELVFDVHNSEIDEMKELIHDKMIHTIPFKVPIVVEMGTGSNWLEAH